MMQVIEFTFPEIWIAAHKRSLITIGGISNVRKDDLDVPRSLSNYPGILGA